MTNFNPRTPCGVRHQIAREVPKYTFISIHAPLAGCDARDVAAGRGNRISIHAPLAGCDTTAGVGDSARAIFQSTHPLRGATAVLRRIRLNLSISIHAPLAGCDDSRKDFFFPFFAISIHAPLAGCDLLSRRSRKLRQHFNPRTPCGVRQQKRTKKCGTFAQKV